VKPLLAILDRQHSGKPGSQVTDRGAGADLDGDGRVDVHEREALLTPRYLLGIEEQLLAAGADVIPISDGTYAERHARAKAHAVAWRKVSADRARAPVVYLAAHLNAFQPGHDRRHGLLIHDARSKGGAALAAAIAAELVVSCPELSQVRVERATSEVYANGLATIAGVYDGIPVGVCLEPFFLDQVAHRPLATAEGLRRVGEAIARGVLAFARS